MFEDNAECCAQEWWRPVVGFEDLYEASSCGRIYSLISDRLMRPTVEEHGRYCLVTLTQRKKQTTRRVHSIVSEAFYGFRDEWLQVCHNDGDGLNNHIANLRYGTSWDNGADRVRHQPECRRGHPLSGDNLYLWTDPKGYTRRYCRTCQKSNMANFHQRHASV